MLKHFIVKAVVYGIICLLVGTSMLSSIPADESSNEKNQQDYQPMGILSNENSIICGYVIDSETGDPLANANVRERWEDSEGNYDYFYTQTNETGFYLFNTEAGFFELYFSYDDYFSEYSPTMSIGDDAIVWYNETMIHYPPETVFFYGFITDDKTGEPVQGANVYLYWYDDESHYWSNSTYSNSSGYYYLGAIPGRTYFDVSSDNYYNYNLGGIFTQNNSVIWLNISLIPYPPVSAIVCGYISDAGNGGPIPYAAVSLNCDTEYGNFHNDTNTNGIGFYSLGTISGSVRIYVYKSDYESVDSESYHIDENETLWINLSMNYEPEVSCRVSGYVVDNETHAAVRNAFVRYDWKDEVGHFYSEYTFTDQKGFYSIMTPEGSVQFLITGNGYTNQQTAWFSIYMGAEKWINTTLSPEIKVMFTKPQPGIYINNEPRFPILTKLLVRFSPNFKPLIIGPLEVTVNVTKSTMGCNRVDFYFDGIYRWSDTEAPFIYYWDEKGFSNHVIMVIAYDNAGPCMSETLMVQKIR